MTNPIEIKFVADVMLGRLSKWLRVMGCDTHYQPFYRSEIIDMSIREGRLLLTRNRRMTEKYHPSLLIETDNVRTQLQEILKKGYLTLDSSRWFTRCLVCNIPLKKIPIEESKAQIPDYIFNQNKPDIYLCPSCGRYFWPGSHKTRMMKQLSEWNLFNTD
ncbi:MAG: Mut7-C RNAse domain-containing protein [Deltaproteobacteria bacterium]|nr:Mut7-C RNAse domain-containing protein [Deltaproteobacteria bacterium]